MNKHLTLKYDQTTSDTNPSNIDLLDVQIKKNNLSVKNKQVKSNTKSQIKPQINRNITDTVPIFSKINDLISRSIELD